MSKTDKKDTPEQVEEATQGTVNKPDESIRLFNKNGTAVNTERIIVSIGGKSCISFDTWIKLMHSKTC